MNMINGLIAAMVGVIVFSAIVFPVIQDTYSTYPVTNETHAAANETILSVDYDNIVNGTLTIYNSTARSITLDEYVDYDVNYEDGKIYFSSANMTDSTDDRSFDYTGYQESYIEGGTTRALFTYMPIMLVIVVLIAIIGLINI